MADDEKRKDPPWGRPLDPSDMEQEGGAQETRPREVPSQEAPPGDSPDPQQYEGPPDAL